MKVEVEDVSSVKRKIHVEVPAEVVSAEFEKAYSDLKKRARLKGFRPGKAPRSILERYYGDQVRYEVTTKLIQESYKKSVDEKSLTPVSQPSIEDAEVRPGEDFHYTAVVEVKPKVDVSDYEGLEVPRQKAEVTDEMVQGRLDEIREMFAQLEKVTEDRGVTEDDLVLVDHRLLKDGEPLTDEKAQEQLLELKSGRVEERIQKALLGLRPGGETVVPQKLPPSHSDPKSADQEGSLHLKVKEIQRKILPELDDAFAKRLGEYQNLDEVKTRVRDELAEEEQRRIRSEMRNAIIEQLLDRHPIEVPEAMVELQIQEMIHNAQRRLAAQGLTLEQTGSTPEGMGARFREPAIRAVRTTLILESISEREGIQTTDEDMENAYGRVAKQTGRDVSEIKALYRDPAALESLRESVLEEKTLDFLMEKARMVDKKSARKNRT